MKFPVEHPSAQFSSPRPLPNPLIQNHSPLFPSQEPKSHSQNLYKNYTSEFLSKTENYHPSRVMKQLEEIGKGGPPRDGEEDENIVGANWSVLDETLRQSPTS